MQAVASLSFDLAKLFADNEDQSIRIELEAWPAHRPSTPRERSAREPVPRGGHRENADFGLDGVQST
jgi:hypothetical protein